MKWSFKSLSFALLLLAAGCASVTIPSERVGVCSWSWQLPMKEVAAQMDRVGVRGIHLALGPFIATDGRLDDSESADAWAFVKDKVERGEWIVMSTTVGMSGGDRAMHEIVRLAGDNVSDETWEANKKILTRGARLTQELNCTCLSTCAGGSLAEANPEMRGKLLGRIRWMRDECRKYGVTLILESGRETAEDLAAFMPKVPGVGIDFDPANMVICSRGRPMQALQVLFPWIKLVRVRDACATKVPGTWGTEVAWGEGEVGGKAFLAELEELGYRGNYAVGRETGNDRPGDIARTIERLVN